METRLFPLLRSWLNWFGVGPCWQVSWAVLCSVLSNSLRSHGLQPVRLPCPWDSPGKNTGLVCYFLFQGIFPTQGLNLGLLHCRQILYCLSHGLWWKQDDTNNINLAKRYIGLEEGSRWKVTIMLHMRGTEASSYGDGCRQEQIIQQREKVIVPVYCLDWRQ